MKSLSERTIAIPFGHYRTAGAAEPPGNEVLVGREGQRAFFIDLLLRAGNRGAFLITGRRGAGKTSFVRYCVAEHEKELLRRLLASQVGRMFFWDWAGIAILGGLFLALVLMISELALGLLEKVKGPDSFSVLALILLVPTALLTLYPLLFAHGLLKDILRSLSRWERDTAYALGSTIGCLAIIASSWYLGPFGDPVSGATHLAASTAALFFWIQATSYKVDVGLKRWWVFSTAVAVLFWLGRHSRWAPFGERSISGDLLCVALFFSVGALFRALHMYLRSEKSRKLKTPLLWYLASGLGLLLVSALVIWLTEFEKNAGPEISVLVLVSSGHLFARLVGWLDSNRLKKKPVGSPRRKQPIAFVPRPTLILLTKVAISIVIGLQLAHPLFSTLFAKSEEQLPKAVAWMNKLSEFLPVIEGRTPTLSQVQPNALFAGWEVRAEWLVAILGLTFLIFTVEYEWVVRPFLRARQDSGIDKKPVSPWDDQERGGYQKKRARALRELAQATLPWTLFKFWLPSLVISVNLGFEKLDHRRVVHSMLASLREAYVHQFVSWRSPYGVFRRVVLAAVLLFLTSNIGNVFLSPKTSKAGVQQGIHYELASRSYRGVCGFFEHLGAAEGLLGATCRLPWGERVLFFLNYNFVIAQPPALEAQRRRFLDWFLPFREVSWPSGEVLPSSDLPRLQYAGLHFRVYHLLLFSSLYLLARLLLRRVPLMPYRESLRRMDEVLDSMVAQTSERVTTGPWSKSGWATRFLLKEEVREKIQEPVDPRTVEFWFLRILGEVQDACIHLPGGQNQRISLPAPEVTFIFDELDKLGTRGEWGEGAISQDPKDLNLVDAERRRSVELHRLFADMKNILSSARARFVFVGGRNLHDEWLADQTARTPTLTNIFDAEVYLPSFFTDHGLSDDKHLTRLTKEYLHTQAVRATELFEKGVWRRGVPWFVLPLERLEDEVFAREDAAIGSLDSYWTTDEGRLEKCDSTDDKQRLKFIGSKELENHFIQFLGYRSMGNPKKLKELLRSFVRPVGRVVEDWRVRDAAFHCDHVLFFGDTERFRVELMAEVFRQLTLRLEERLVERDDKVAVAFFFLADFVLKFHGRAFSWSNLERVDELVHIHRAPDLRDLLEEMVIQWSEVFLHPIRNGMYDFRFRSDHAREIEYVSRQSYDEMAAFNFTLDESLTLKALFEGRIASLGDKGGTELQDLVAGLGELYEFDQEYETARLHYRRAIALIDGEWERTLGAGDVFDETGPISAMLRGDERSQENIRLYLTWGIARLRLMLQVGMTFELARNLERAEVEYRNARTLSEALRLAMLDTSGRRIAVDEFGAHLKVAEGEERLHGLKNLNVIFQAVFAEAWVSEKRGGGVDTSLSLAEAELHRVRSVLPFVRNPRLELSRTAANVSGSNFSLITAELENKLGDMHFFKGRQPVDALAAIQTAEAAHLGLETARLRREGYLLKAHYHYAAGLHDLRRFVTHRIKSSAGKFNPWDENLVGFRWPTIAESGWPDFVLRAVGGALSDISEAMLGRVSFLNIDARLVSSVWSAGEDHCVQMTLNSLERQFDSWLENAPPEPFDEAGSPQHRVVAHVKRRQIGLGSLEGWFGSWLGGKEEVVSFGETKEHEDPERLLLGLQLSLVGARLLERGGYSEDAAREQLQVCETVAQYLWWRWQVLRVTNEFDVGPFSLLFEATWPIDSKVTNWYWEYLLDLAICALSDADRLFRASRRVGEEDETSQPAISYLVGNKVPWSALTLACSLGLAAEWIGVYNSTHEEQLRKLIGHWLGNKKTLQDARSATLRSVLVESVSRHSYPMINRLHSLKVLIDDQIEQVFSQQNTTGCKDVVHATQELLSLRSKLSATMHFSPIRSGTTAALAALLAKKCGSPSRAVERAATRDLDLSLQMCTLKRAYYENISNLYYLYDDFNDRQLHFNHAIQMSGAEVATLLLTALGGSTSKRTGP